MSRLTAISLVALAAALVAGGAAVADSKKQRSDSDFGLQYDENGVPIIMQGYSSPKRGSSPSAEPAGEQPRLRADRPVPRGSGGSSLVAPAGPPTPRQPVPQPVVQPYIPPPINTFSDRVTKCIQSYPLNAGIGNNPRDQQSYIRQCANN